MRNLLVALAILLTGVPTDTWDSLTAENQAAFVQLLGNQYFERHPECAAVHVWAEDDGEVTMLYGECEEEKTPT